jgi:hypothetical protein
LYVNAQWDEQSTAGKRLRKIEGYHDALESTAEGDMQIVYPD